jgi:hypothetical protein
MNYNVMINVLNLSFLLNIECATIEFKDMEIGSSNWVQSAGIE